jgi:urocanate hydratase
MHVPGPSANSSHDLQTRCLSDYTLLSECPPSGGWAGSLILNLGLDLGGSALSLAAHISGAACLSLEADADRLRTALRTGACDFIVNTLDEALRILKNEVRQHRPISVGVGGSQEQILAELIDRGVAPSLMTARNELPTAALGLSRFGTRLLNLAAKEDAPGAFPAWTLYREVFSTGASLRRFDEAVIDLLPPDDLMRRRWLLAAARIFPRDRHRVIWLSEDEAAALG